MKTFKENIAGWHLFFHEPTGVKYQFINPFWGRDWDGTAKNLKDISFEGTALKLKGDQERHRKHAIWVFLKDGEERFAFCSWTLQVYNFRTKSYTQLEGNRLSEKITEAILAQA